MNLVNVARRQWERLFENGPNLFYEAGLTIMLLRTLWISLGALLRSRVAFRDEDAFSQAAVSIHPVGWAWWLPVNLVTSQAFERAVAVVIMISCGCWLLKRCLPWSALCGATSYGFYVSLCQSRIANYRHETLPDVAMLVVFAAFYTLRRREIIRAVNAHRFWERKLYPNWVYALCITYMGLYYTFGGLSKLAAMRTGVWQSGLTLQLLLWKPDPLPVAAVPIVRNYAIANLSMIASIVLETGALAAFTVRWLRPWWATGLITMHVLVLLTLHIDFRSTILVLIWIAWPWQRILSALGPRIGPRIGPRMRGVLQRQSPTDATAEVSAAYPRSRADQTVQRQSPVYFRRTQTRLSSHVAFY